MLTKWVTAEEKPATETEKFQSEDGRKWDRERIILDIKTLITQYY